MRTTVKSGMSLKLGKIQPWTADIPALERPGKPSYTYNGRMEEVLWHSSVFIFDWIFFCLQGNGDVHNILNELEFRPDPN